MAEKLYKIGEAAELLKLKTYVLRFWEMEFPQLAPTRTQTGQRLYSEKDLGILQRIRHLLHERGLTIEGARKQLAEEERRQAASGKNKNAAQGGSLFEACDLDNPLKSAPTESTPPPQKSRPKAVKSADKTEAATPTPEISGETPVQAQPEAPVGPTVAENVPQPQQVPQQSTPPGVDPALINEIIAELDALRAVLARPLDWQTLSRPQLGAEAALPASEIPPLSPAPEENSPASPIPTDGEMQPDGGTPPPPARQIAEAEQPAANEQAIPEAPPIQEMQPIRAEIPVQQPVRAEVPVEQAIHAETPPAEQPDRQDNPDKPNNPDKGHNAPSRFRARTSVRRNPIPGTKPAPQANGAAPGEAEQTAPAQSAPARAATQNRPAAQAHVRTRLTRLQLPKSPAQEAEHAEQAAGKNADSEQQNSETRPDEKAENMS